MIRQVRLQSRAALDLRDHYLYLIQQDARLAARFADAIENSFAWLAHNPDLGFATDFTDARLQDVRCWPVRGFLNHLIFYRVPIDSIEVLRVLHGSRDAPALL
jgi:toxin ParE1/3/4